MLHRVFEKYHHISFINLLVVFSFSIAILLGWCFGVNTLRSGIFGSILINPTTALTFIFSGLSVLFLGHVQLKSLLIGIFLAIVVFTIGLVRLAEFEFSIHVGISDWLFTKDINIGRAFKDPILMAPNTALCFVFIGASLGCHYFLPKTRIKLVDYFALGSLLISFLSIIGHTYNAPEFYSIESFLPMAFPTAVCFFLLSISILLSTREVGLFREFNTKYEGSKMARLIIPFALFIPMIAGLFSLYGIGAHTPGYGACLFTLITVILFVLLIFTSTKSINTSQKNLIQEMERTKELTQKLLSEEKKAFELALIKTKVDQHKRLIEAFIEGQENEKKAIGMELHDHINQVLACSKLYIEMAKSDENRRDQLLDKSRQQISEVINDIRKLSKSLVLHSSESGGLLLQIQEMIDGISTSTGISFNLYIDEESINCLEKNKQLNIFRIVQEQLNNILKYAQADQIGIILRNNNAIFQLEIEDNGKGFDTNSKSHGIGLSNIKSRTEMLNGEMEIISQPNQGCKLIVRLPALSKSEEVLNEA